MKLIAVQPPTNATLEDMFRLHKVLVDQFIQMGDIPECPLYDLTASRSNQKVVKDFAYRIIEELGEAGASLENAYLYVSANNAGEASTYIEQYNEELADVWHFMLELLMLSRIDIHAISQWANGLVREDERLSTFLSSQSILGGLLKYAEFLNNQDGMPYVKTHRNLFVIIPDVDAMNEQVENMGGRKISLDVLNKHAEFFWAITQKLTGAMNFLKIRAWHKDDDRKGNLIEYTNHLMESFLYLLRLMVYTGKTEYSIYLSYVYKNRINLERNKEHL